MMMRQEFKKHTPSRKMVKYLIARVSYCMIGIQQYLSKYKSSTVSKTRPLVIAGIKRPMRLLGATVKRLTGHRQSYSSKMSSWVRSCLKNPRSRLKAGLAELQARIGAVIAPALLGSKRYSEPPTGYLQGFKLFEATTVEYGMTPVGAQKIEYVEITPSNPQRLLWAFHGQGTNVRNKNTALGMLIQAELTQSKLVAFSLPGQSQSSGTLARTATEMRSQINRLAKIVVSRAKEDQQNSKLPKAAKIVTYGLCFGGMQAVIAADKLLSNPSFTDVFSHAVISRSSSSFWRLWSLCQDYTQLLPQWADNKNDCRSESQGKNQQVAKLKQKNKISAWLRGLMRSLKKCCQKGIVALLQSTRYLANEIRICLWTPVLWVMGWCLDVSAEIRRLEHRNKCWLLGVKDDEFIVKAASAGRIARHAEQLAYCPYQESSDCTLEGPYQQLYQDYQKISGNDQTKSEQDFATALLSEASYKHYSVHQEWSQRLFKFHQDKWMSELDYISKMPDYCSHQTPSQHPYGFGSSVTKLGYWGQRVTRRVGRTPQKFKAVMRRCLGQRR